MSMTALQRNPTPTNGRFLAVNLPLMLASVCAMKLSACCCTRRYSVVCSGRWRS